MGSQSRRFRASQIVDFELFNLGSLLFLCLGLLIRTADYGNMFQYANSGAFVSWEQRSEVITIANPGALSLEQKTSEVIAIANSASSNVLGGRCTVCGNYPSEDECGDPFQYADPGAFSLEQKTSEVFTISIAACGNFDGRYSVHLPLFEDWNSSWPYNFDLTRSFLKVPDFTPNKSHAIVSNAITLSQNSSCEKYPLSLFSSPSGTIRCFPGFEEEAVRLEYVPRRRPWFRANSMKESEVVMDNRNSMGATTELAFRFPSNANYLDAGQKIPPEFVKVEKRRYFRCFPEDDHFHLYDSHTGRDFRNVTQNNILLTGVVPAPFYSGETSFDDQELRAKVISIVHSGSFIFVIILILAWKRIKNVILFNSSNRLDGLNLEESDLDESYLASQILYENLLREAVLVSEGASGRVFKVTFLGLECAMKVFHSNARMDFRKESIALTKLSHPNIVQFFCSFRKSFIIMELMELDLFSFITKIRERRIDYEMPLEVALDVMLQIAEGMSYLHNQGIAHQDLKSLNILLKLRGDCHDIDFKITAKVADFGSARSFDPRNPRGFVLFPNTNIGTRLWRAPELFHPRGGCMNRVFGMTPRILPKPLDIYGFAVICSELLTKQIPFSDDRDLQVAVLSTKIREGHRPALPSDGCPEGLVALITDCWHRDPFLRPEFHEVCTRLIEVKSSWMSRGGRLSAS